MGKCGDARARRAHDARGVSLPRLQPQCGVRANHQGDHDERRPPCDAFASPAHCRASIRPVAFQIVPPRGFPGRNRLASHFWKILNIFLQRFFREAAMKGDRSHRVLIGLRSELTHHQYWLHYRCCITGLQALAKQWRKEAIEGCHTLHVRRPAFSRRFQSCRCSTLSSSPERQGSLDCDCGGNRRSRSLSGGRDLLPSAKDTTRLFFEE